MSLTDAQLFSMWGPKCSGKSAEVSLHGRGVVTVAPAIIPAVRALNSCLIHWNYQTRAADTGAFNCRKKVGSNGWSVHSLKIALDINWQSNPYGRRLITNFPPPMRAAIKGIRTNNGKQVWEWGGDWDGNKDAMHWQICCSPRDLATGINMYTVPGGAVTPPPYVPPAPAPAPTPAPQPQPQPTPIFTTKDNDMKLFRDFRGGIWIVLSTGRRRHVTEGGAVPILQSLLGVTLFDLGPGSPFQNELLSLLIEQAFPPE